MDRRNNDAYGCHWLVKAVNHTPSSLSVHEAHAHINPIHSIGNSLKKQKPYVLKYNT